PRRDGLVDQTVALANRQRVERAFPIFCSALQVEQRFEGPGKPRVELERPLGELARRLPLALALGLQKEAAQAQLLGIGRGQHGLEDAPRCGPVADELSRLGTQKMGERLVWQRLARLPRVSDGQWAVAGTDGDHAARQRAQPALLPPSI